MAVLSTKDKIKLRVSAAKVERWKTERLKDHADNAIRGTTFTAWSFGQEKPAMSYPDKDTIESDNAHMRSSSDKLARDFKRYNDTFADYANDPAPLPKPKPIFVTPRADSPFKVNGRRRVVVIERK